MSEIVQAEIKRVISILQSTSTPVTVNSITHQIKDLIVNEYDGNTSLFAYKATWCHTIKEVLRSMNLSIKRSNVNWEQICMLIMDKKLGIIHPATDANLYLSNNTIPNQNQNQNNPISGEIEQSTTTQTSKLVEADKVKIRTLYANLDGNKMWTLSNGTIVEKKMEEFALACNFEHPVHSMILDTTDKCWKNYFSESELQEIQTEKVQVLPDLPTGLQSYIDIIKIMNPVELEEKLQEKTKDPATEWMRLTILDFLRLFQYHYMPFTDQTEGDLLRRVWFFIDTVFDDSMINCRGGEKSCKASSKSRNQDRSLSSIDRMTRKLVGRKVDMLYKTEDLEYGCCECGRYDDETKEFNDGGFKIVKVLRDMLYQIYQTGPESLREIVVPGFLLFEKKFTLITCDSPAGYVSRIKRCTPVNLPTHMNNMSKLFAILQGVYQARLFMEQTQNIAENTTTTVHYDDKPKNDILPCFYSEANNQKRRRSQ